MVHKQHPAGSGAASSDRRGEFYRQMVTIRCVEEALLDLFTKGLLNGTVHTCLGQEACAVGVVNALDASKDIIFSNHRCHGHYLAFTDDVEGLVAELMGRASGVCGGVGGSQHLHRGNFYSNGIQGGIVPVATGMAFAEKVKKSGALAAVFLGDGTMGQGVVYESFNLASKWRLPVLFVIEDNGYAQTTPKHLVHTEALMDRPRAFGIDVHALKAEDVSQVYALARAGVAQVRSTGGPTCLYLETYRFGPHSKGDDMRPREEIDAHRARDPLAKLGASLDAALRAGIETAATERVEKAIAHAQSEPSQDFGVYRTRVAGDGGYAS